MPRMKDKLGLKIKTSPRAAKTDNLDTTVLVLLLFFSTESVSLLIRY